MSGEAIEYDAGHITVLEGRHAIRKRPGMYVGSTGERGLRQLVFDVAERAVNEVLAGTASRVDITFLADGGVRVADDGPGVPVEAAGHTGGPGLETLLTRPLTGPDTSGRHGLTSGLFDVGPCVTTALSSRLTAEVRREGTRWVQEYVRGAALAPPTAMGPASGSGTALTFWPDADIFETTEFVFGVFEERFRELAFLNRDLDVSLTDERPPGGPRSVRFRFPDGVREFVAYLDREAGRAGTAGTAGRAPHPDVIAFERDTPAATVDVALRWSDSREERVRGFANSWPAFEGSTHLLGFRDGLVGAVNAYARGRGLLAAADADLSADRIGEGLTAVVSVKLDRPEFLGATRGLLGNAAVLLCVTEVVQEHLGRWFEERPEQAGAIVGRFL
ncbi:DNA gyrase subunit B [Streptomyces sp. SAI-117]|uniref:DNA gyrase subunit B n=1 Tax=Streptomyces sp. SAI-117 TaxID=2940546 RepID=UPI002475C710|nr:DNA gyrase subunit B [Streptomyces sp. SAI-117]MDH6569897.1 DNA gyrase subunit B [Streptomyces sp. SAI-117]